jgi:hypothetical protein
MATSTEHGANDAREFDAFDRILRTIAKAPSGWLSVDEAQAYEFKPRERKKLAEVLESQKFPKEEILEITNSLESHVQFYKASREKVVAVQLTQEQIRLTEKCRKKLKDFEESLAQWVASCSELTVGKAFDLHSLKTQSKAQLKKVEQHFEEVLKLKRKQGAPVKWREYKLAYGVLQTLEKKPMYTQYKAEKILDMLFEIIDGYYAEQIKFADRTKRPASKALLQWARRYRNTYLKMFRQKT